jgi:aryl-alcohol dehydrogenase-like predicted oxidoreductase
MRYVTLGHTGMRVSGICLGMLSYGKNASRAWTIDRWPWTLDAADAEPIVRAAVEGGVNFFDTADVYNGGESEVVTGQLLRKLFGLREEYVLATKVRMPSMPGENGWGLSRKHIMAAIDASLERLGTDYVDLYQIHRWDRETPIEETMDALHDVVKAGKARYIGASNMFAWQFAKAQSVAQTRLVSMQNHYNLIYREEEREMIPQCLDMGVGVLPFSPLARGLLAGNRSRLNEKLTARARSDAVADEVYKPELDRPVIERLAEAADRREVPAAQMALAWLLHKPGVTAPIVGATKVHHVADALAAEELELAAGEIALLEQPYQAHPISGHTKA